MAEIPIPPVKLPPELKTLVDEIRKSNQRIEENEKKKKPSVDAEFIVKKFHHDMHGFEEAYAYLTEKLADILVKSFAENIAEVTLTNDFIQQSNDLLLGISQTMSRCSERNSRITSYISRWT